MKRTLTWICLICTLAFASCTKKVVSPANPVIDPLLNKSEAALLEKVMSTKVPYTWFAGSGQGKIDWEGQRLSAKFNVRILRDSVIWIQISKLGFEVGRMYVTPDSAFVINRLEHSYGAYETLEFLEEYNVPADFDMFSSVFTAGAFVPPLRDPSITVENEAISITGHGASALYWFDRNSTLTRSMIIDPYDREWSAGYGDYRGMGKGIAWPYLRSNTLVIDGEANVFDLEYSEIEIDAPQTFPFSIPSHYDKM